MIFKPRTTHVVPTLLLLSVAVVPAAHMGTLGAYGDIETSSANTFQAGIWGEVLQIETFSLVLDTPQEPLIESGDVAGTSTEPGTPTPEGVGGPADNVGLELSEPVVETTIDSPPPSQPEGVEEGGDEPVVEVSEPVVEITTPEEPEEPETEPEAEPEPAPEPEPTPDLTPSTEPAP